MPLKNCKKLEYFCSLVSISPSALLISARSYSVGLTRFPGAAVFPLWTMVSSETGGEAGGGEGADCGTAMHLRISSLRYVLVRTRIVSVNFLRSAWVFYLLVSLIAVKMCSCILEVGETHSYSSSHGDLLSNEMRSVKPTPII